MRNLILFDDEIRDHLLPLTFTRPVSELRTGIFTIREKWELLLAGSASHITTAYLTGKYPIRIDEDNFVINGSVLPNKQLVRLIEKLDRNEALMSDGNLVVARIPGDEFDALIDGSFGEEIAGYSLLETPVAKLARCWDIFRFCGQTITDDLELIKQKRDSMPLSPTNRVIGKGEIFIEKGATVEHCILNTDDGPVYIGEDALVMEGSMLRGPVAVCKGAVVKMGAKIYGPSVFGPFSKVGGEVNNCVFQGYSNKGHDGFLGNSVLGEWCNLGADTNCSNLKNTYTPVSIWNYAQGDFEQTELQFCGLIMGDHSKCGINTMFNTGTVVGVSANIFGAGFPPKFIPSFSWGGRKDSPEYQFDKAMDTATRMMMRRNKALNDEDIDILRKVFEETSGERSGADV